MWNQFSIETLYAKDGIFTILGAEISFKSCEDTLDFMVMIKVAIKAIQSRERQIKNECPRKSNEEEKRMKRNQESLRMQNSLMGLDNRGFCQSKSLLVLLKMKIFLKTSTIQILNIYFLLIWFQEVGRRAHYYNTSLADFTYRFSSHFFFKQKIILCLFVEIVFILFLFLGIIFILFLFSRNHFHVIFSENKNISPSYFKKKFQFFFSFYKWFSSYCFFCY